MIRVCTHPYSQAMMCSPSLSLIKLASVSLWAPWVFVREETNQRGNFFLIRFFERVLHVFRLSACHIFDTTSFRLLNYAFLVQTTVWLCFLFKKKIPLLEGHITQSLSQARQLICRNEKLTSLQEMMLSPKL